MADRYNLSLEERKRVLLSGYKRVGDCWEWQKYVDSGGYGQMQVHGKVVRTHRAAWMLLVGPIPRGKLVCHRCDNRKCINPAHLFLGTSAENVKDASNKGRMPRGARHWNAKLTEIDVLRVRALSLAGKSQTAIASQFGVCRASIGFAISGKTWGHI